MNLQFNERRMKNHPGKVFPRAVAMAAGQTNVPPGLSGGVAVGGEREAQPRSESRWFDRCLGYAYYGVPANAHFPESVGWTYKSKGLFLMPANQTTC